MAGSYKELTYIFLYGTVHHFSVIDSSSSFSKPKILFINKSKIDFDPDVIRTRNLLIWSQTCYRCATESTSKARAYSRYTFIIMASKKSITEMTRLFLRRAIWLGFEPRPPRFVICDVQVKQMHFKTFPDTYPRWSSG